MTRQSGLLMTMLTAFVGLAFVACGGGGSGGGGGGGIDGPTVKSNSYFPTGAVDDSGNPSGMVWKYLVNGGQPISAGLEGISVSLTFEDYVTVSVDAAGTARTVIGGGPLSGSSQGIQVTGSFSVRNDEALYQTGSGTGIGESSLQMGLVMSAEGETVNADLSSVVSYDEPALWWPDRLDLASLGVGHQEQFDFSGDVDVTVHMYGSGIDQTQSDSDHVSDTEHWRIVNRLESMQVLGNTYWDVYVVERDTRAPTNTTGGTESVTITYWMAKGIGMIKADGAMSILNQRPTWELAQTNLVQ